jgi:pilus assembly protein CpaE
MRTVIAADNLTRRDAIREAALALGLSCQAADCVAPGELPARLASQGADLVLVAVGPDAARSLEVIRYAAGLGAGPVLAVGPTQDPQTILQAIRQGAREYLDEQRLGEDLAAALAKLRGDGPVRGRVLAVLGAVPGSGVTTVAAGLAFALARGRSGGVALFEFGEGPSALAAALDAKPRHTVADLVESGGRLDGTMLRQTAVVHDAGVHVFAQPAERLDVSPPDGGAAERMLLLARALYEQVVVDWGHGLPGAGLRALHLADRLVTVVRLDVPGLRLAKALLRALKEAGADEERVAVVANRYGERGQLGWRQAEKALGRKVLEWVPNDPATLNEALNHGRPVVQFARRGRLARSFARLAAQLAAADGPGADR